MVKNLTSPKEVALDVFNGAIDILVDAIEKNEERTARYQKPLPLPEFNVPEMIETVRTLASDAHTRKTLNGENTNGSVDDWRDESIKYLKRELSRYAKSNANPPELMRQIIKAWPELTPPPKLSKEQEAKLRELQGRFDDLTSAMMQTIKDGMEEMARLIKEEVSIISNTNAQDTRLLHKQAACYVGLWQGVISAIWSQKNGFCNTPIAQIERDILRQLPRKWE